MRTCVNVYNFQIQCCTECNCIINAAKVTYLIISLGLKMLTNQKRGDFYGVVSNWPVKKKRELGVHLLYRAMQIFLAEGERQLRPLDIRE